MEAKVKLSYLIPEGQYDFFRQIIPYLEEAGVKVYVNDVYNDQDVIIAAILPITHNWYPTLRETTKPFILWHWDLYSFTDYAEPRWMEFLSLMRDATDIWSCTYETARELKEQRGYDSYMMPAWVEELSYMASHREPYVYYAASSGGFGKRVEWAERACKLLNYKFICTMNQKLPRDEYLRLLGNCRVYAMTAFEESNATIPAQEAAVMGKPVVLADLPASREVFGNEVYYFQPNDFRGLSTALHNAWVRGPILGGRERILHSYHIKKVATRMVRRLTEILCH